MRVPECTCSTCADDVLLVQEALKFMRHSKRVTLSTDDINSALVASGKEVRRLGPSALLPCLSSSQSLSKFLFWDWTTTMTLVKSVAAS